MSEKYKTLAAIGYIPFLCFIPLFAIKDDEFSRFHGKQSLVLLVSYIILSIGLWLFSVIFIKIFGNVPLIGFIFKAMGWIAHNVIGTLIAIIYVILIIIAIIFTLAGNKWEIPMISTYAKNLRI